MPPACGESREDALRAVVWLVPEDTPRTLDIMHPPLVRRDREHDVVPLGELGLDGPLDDVRAVAAAEEEGVIARLRREGVVRAARVSP